MQGDVQSAKRCKRYNERERLQRVQRRVGAHVDFNSIGGLRQLAETYSFECVSKDAKFDPHTPYLVPGWTVGDDGSLLLMFTTFNLVLNVFRAREYFRAAGVTFAIDHTFKVCSRGFVAFSIWC